MFPVANMTLPQLWVRALDRPVSDEIHRVVSMLRVVDDRPDLEVGTLFTCVHWDPKTKLCMNYDERPKYMCGKYPYGGLCYWCWSTNGPKLIGDPCIVWPVPETEVMLVEKEQAVSA